MNRLLSTAAALALTLAACGEADLRQTGPSPEIPDVRETLVPAMNIARPVGWGDERPTVPDGFMVTALATDLQLPRQMLVLPNGDILVAEGRGGNAPALRPKDVILSFDGHEVLHVAIQQSRGQYSAGHLGGAPHPHPHARYTVIYAALTA